MTSHCHTVYPSALLPSYVPSATTATTCIPVTASSSSLVLTFSATLHALLLPFLSPPLIPLYLPVLLPTDSSFLGSVPFLHHLSSSPVSRPSSLLPGLVLPSLSLNCPRSAWHTCWLPCTPGAGLCHTAWFHAWLLYTHLHTFHTFYFHLHPSLPSSYLHFCISGHTFHPIQPPSATKGGFRAKTYSCVWLPGLLRYGSASTYRFAHIHPLPVPSVPTLLALYPFDVRLLFF